MNCITDFQSDLVNKEISRHICFRIFLFFLISETNYLLEKTAKSFCLFFQRFYIVIYKFISNSRRKITKFHVQPTLSVFLLEENQIILPSCFYVSNYLADTNYFNSG